MRGFNNAGGSHRRIAFDALIIAVSFRSNDKPQGRPLRACRWRRMLCPIGSQEFIRIKAASEKRVRSVVNNRADSRAYHCRSFAL